MTPTEAAAANPITNPGRRIVVIGTSGSGKSTLAEQLSKRLNIPSYDLDELHWGANWTPVPFAVFQERVRQVVRGECWIIAGNYSKVREQVWPRAETLIWLDYALPLILWRLFKRSLSRMITQEELWGGNRERFRTQFLSRDSLFLWALQSHPRHRRTYPELFKQPAYAHLSVVHLHSPRETECWFQGLGEDRG